VVRRIRSSVSAKEESRGERVRRRARRGVPLRPAPTAPAFRKTSAKHLLLDPVSRKQVSSDSRQGGARTHELETIARTCRFERREGTSRGQSSDRREDNAPPPATAGPCVEQLPGRCSRPRLTLNDDRVRSLESDSSRVQPSLKKKGALQSGWSSHAQVFKDNLVELSAPVICRIGRDGEARRGMSTITC